MVTVCETCSVTEKAYCMNITAPLIVKSLIPNRIHPTQTRQVSGATFPQEQTALQHGAIPKLIEHRTGLNWDLSGGCSHRLQKLAEPNSGNIPT